MSTLDSSRKPHDESRRAEIPDHVKVKDANVAILQITCEGGYVRGLGDDGRVYQWLKAHGGIWSHYIEIYK